MSWSRWPSRIDHAGTAPQLPKARPFSTVRWSGRVGEYQLQAAIAAIHDQPPRPGHRLATDPGPLRSAGKVTGNPVVTLNRAVAAPWRMGRLQPAWRSSIGSKVRCASTTATALSVATYSRLSGDIDGAVALVPACRTAHDQPRRAASPSAARRAPLDRRSSKSTMGRSATWVGQMTHRVAITVGAVIAALTITGSVTSAAVGTGSTLVRWQALQALTRTANAAMFTAAGGPTRRSPPRRVKPPRVRQTKQKMSRTTHTMSPPITSDRRITAGTSHRPHTTSRRPARITAKPYPPSRAATTASLSRAITSP